MRYLFVIFVAFASGLSLIFGRDASHEFELSFEPDSVVIKYINIKLPPTATTCFYAIERRSYEDFFMSLMNKSQLINKDDSMQTYENDEAILYRLSLRDKDEIAKIIKLLKDCKAFPPEAVKHSPSKAWRNSTYDLKNAVKYCPDSTRDDIGIRGKIEYWKNGRYIDNFFSPFSIDIMRFRYVISPELKGWLEAQGFDIL